MSTTATRSTVHVPWCTRHQQDPPSSGWCASTLTATSSRGHQLRAEVSDADGVRRVQIHEPPGLDVTDLSPADARTLSQLLLDAVELAEAGQRAQRMIALDEKTEDVDTGAAKAERARTVRRLHLAGWCTHHMHLACLHELPTGGSVAVWWALTDLQPQLRLHAHDDTDLDDSADLIARARAISAALTQAADLIDDAPRRQRSTQV